MEYNFEHINTVILDPNIYGSDKEITFKCEGFIYYVRCIDGILQYVKGESPSSYLSWPIPPTNEEIINHDNRRHIFNENHSIVQDWINTL